MKAPYLYLYVLIFLQKNEISTDSPFNFHNLNGRLDATSMKILHTNSIPRVP